MPAGGPRPAEDGRVRVLAAEAEAGRMVLVRGLQLRRAAAAVAEDDLGDLPRALGLQLRHDVQHGPDQ